MSNLCDKGCVSIMRSIIQIFMLGGLLSLSSQAYPQDDTIVKTYPLVISDTNSIIEAVKAITADKAKIYFYHPNNELIISATSNQHSAITSLLKEINIPSPNVRVDVVFLQAGQEVDFALGTSSEQKPKVTRKGNTLQFDITPRIRGQSTTTMNNNSQTVVVKNGKQASIFMGTAVPFYLWLVDFAVKWQYVNIIEQKFEMKQVGSALVVEPHILNRGPLISVILTPEISGVIDGKPHRIQFSRIATEVTVSSGHPVTIGTFGKNSQFYDKFLVGIDRHGNNQSIQVRLTATIISNPAPR
ncbi:MAG: hypothetical protein A2283_19450 [Lentisphaerae bacterium RIFOXYA12_FULL_48_11]|nr:MAG: hypothetical protein A2283_19450 [Lentisphaerae bacterium RIFOXYA12_FULL_48_11]